MEIRLDVNSMLDSICHNMPVSFTMALFFRSFLGAYIMHTHVPMYACVFGYIVKESSIKVPMEF